MSDDGLDKLNLLEIPSSLIEKMQKAGTYEELIGCWEELAVMVNFDEAPKYNAMDLTIADQLLFNLDKMRTCFSGGSFACDSFARNLVNDQQLKEALVNSGIPLEFILQTVRVGAVKELLIHTETRPGNVVELVSPLSNDLSGGFNWANGHLEELEDRKAEEGKRAKEIEALRVEQSKDVAIVEIGEKMRESGYEMSAEHKALLKDDVQQKLGVWKAFCDKCLSSTVMEAYYIGEFSDQEITPELFAKFKEACEKDSEVSQFLQRGINDFPFEIMNPESGWFYALLKNNKTTFRGFLSAAVSNMENWFHRTW